MDTLDTGPLVLRIGDTLLSERPLGPDVPMLAFEFRSTAEVIVEIMNVSDQPFASISHIYFCTSPGSLIALHEEKKIEMSGNVTTTSFPIFTPNPVLSAINRDELKIHFKVNRSLPQLPPGAFEQITLPMAVKEIVPLAESFAKLRLLTETAVHEFPFKISVRRDTKRNSR